MIPTYEELAQAARRYLECQRTVRDIQKYYIFTNNNSCFDECPIFREENYCFYNQEGIDKAYNEVLNAETTLDKMLAQLLSN